MHGMVSLATAVPVTETSIERPFGHVTSALHTIVTDPLVGMGPVVGTGRPVLISTVHGKPVIATLRLASPQFVIVNVIWTGPLAGSVTWLSSGKPPMAPLFAS